MESVNYFYYQLFFSKLRISYSKYINIRKTQSVNATLFHIGHCEERVNIVDLFCFSQSLLTNLWGMHGVMAMTPAQTLRTKLWECSQSEAVGQDVPGCQHCLKVIIKIYDVHLVSSIC